MSGQTIEFTCTKCGNTFSAEAMYAGCECECPNCGERCIVPDARQTAHFKINETRKNDADFDCGNFARRRFMARFADIFLGNALAFLLVFACTAAGIGTAFIEWLVAPEHEIAVMAIESLFVFFPALWFIRCSGTRSERNFSGSARAMKTETV